MPGIPIAPQRLSPPVGVPAMHSSFDGAAAYKPQDGIHNPSALDYPPVAPPAASDAFLHGSSGYWRPRDPSPPAAYGAWGLPVKESDIDLAPRQLFSYHGGIAADPAGGGFRRSPELAARLGDRGASELSSLHAVLQVGRSFFSVSLYLLSSVSLYLLFNLHLLSEKYP
jgi:hypothetical protein